MTPDRRSTRVLKGYLVLVFLANVAGMSVLALNLQDVLVRYPRLTPALAGVLVAAGLASLVAVVLIWAGHRSGVITIAVSYAVMLTVNLHYGAPAAHTALGPVGLVLLGVLVGFDRERFRRDRGRAPARDNRRPPGL